MTTTTETTTHTAGATTATPSAIATAVHVYRTSSRRVRRIMATDPAGEARDTASLIRRRDAAWRYLIGACRRDLARLIINEEAALLRIAARRALGEDTTDLFDYLGQTRAYLRQGLADLHPRETSAHA